MKKHLAALVVSLLVLALGAVPAAATGPQVIVNGSFETGDYSGWTLTQNSGDPTAGTWGIGANHQTIQPGESTYDFFDRIYVRQTSPGLPLTFTTPDGSYLAYELGNDSEDFHLYQDIAIPSNLTTLSWSMEYKNWAGTFDPTYQFLAVTIRDLSDNFLETLYSTPESSGVSIPMTSFSRNLSAYAGSTIRLDIEIQAQIYYFDVALDNFRLSNTPTVPALSNQGLIGAVLGMGALTAWILWKRRTNTTNIKYCK